MEYKILSYLNIFIFFLLIASFYYFYIKYEILLKNINNSNKIKEYHNDTENLSNIDITFKDDLSSKTLLSVSKQVSKHWDNENINVYENEKKWLNILKNTDIIAKPIHFDDKNRIITTEYSGERINLNNLPDDWEQQRDYIISKLKEYNCSHNDIKPEEILIKDGKIKLIDFGWANKLNENIPECWPKCLGSHFKCNQKNYEFNDKCSFDKSIFYIKTNRFL